MEEELKNKILELVRPGYSILDLGCGSLSQAACLFKKIKARKNIYINYVGVDQTPYLITDINCCVCLEDNIEIDQVVFNKHFKMEIADVYKFCMSSLKKNQFDCIILSQILHFLENKNAVSILKKCFSDIKEGGIIYVEVMHDEFEKRMNQPHTFSSQRYIALKSLIPIVWSDDKNPQSGLKFIGKKHYDI